ncbi:PPOX class F420-dependent oxidoreductase [Rugosimonospora africana]|uniref:PPOX class F420-dependent enzyme n=1 Tax=Rugosimonospora africana TaxID=556532 RepID=A0A8J3QPB9_9ACTN|nr:PPOX class F420-dependent oxidoreductase [Rugosimonospora africana]GIH14955.1 PPOX class F420-dependent enzyme [Rugosimonospora africana]
MTPASRTGVALAGNQYPIQNPHQELTTMLDPDVRRVLDGTPTAHLASVLPDGAPHAVPVWIGTHGEHVAILTGPGSRKARNLRRDPRIALSLTPTDNPFQPVIVRGRVVEWIEGDAAWQIIDRISTKYTGGPYSRDEQRVVALIEPDRQIVG